MLEPMMSTWPEAESVFKRMTKCGVRDGVRAFAALRCALGESLRLEQFA